MEIVEALRQKLSGRNQEHLLKYYDELDEQERTRLLEQLGPLDLDRLDAALASCDRLETLARINDHCQPVSEDRILDLQSLKDTSGLERRGLELIARGRLGVVLLADAWSTEMLAVPSCKSLFQIVAERLLKVTRLAGSTSGAVPLYITATGARLSAIRELFDENDHFGLRKENVRLFEQEALVCVDEQGRVCMESKSRLATASDGSGCLLAALRRHGLLDDMRRRGVEFVHICGTAENVLVRAADPVFAGLCVERGAECAVKVFERKSRWETCDLVCAFGESVRVVAGGLVSKQNSVRTKPGTDELVLNTADAGYYHVTLGFLESMIERESSLVYYKMRDTGHLLSNESGRVEKAAFYRLEKLLWDLFPPDLLLVKVAEREEFSRSVESLLNLHAHWLEAAGGRFRHSGSRVNSMYRRNDQHSSKDLPVLCEISPLISYSGEGLEELVRGRCFEAPVVLDLDEAVGQVTFNGLDFEAYDSAYPTAATV